MAIYPFPTPEEWRVFFHGEPVKEDECVCPRHGARLRLDMVRGMVCHECDLEDETREHEEMLAEISGSQHCLAAFDAWAEGRCREIRGPGFVGFQCTMPA